MKIIYSVMIGFLCLLSVHGQPYKTGGASPYGWENEGIQPFDVEWKTSGSQLWDPQPGEMFAAQVSDNPDDWGGIELGGIERVSDVTNEVSILMLIAMVYFSVKIYKRYRSRI